MSAEKASMKNEQDALAGAGLAELTRGQHRHAPESRCSQPPSRCVVITTCYTLCPYATVFWFLCRPIFVQLDKLIYE